MEMEIRSALKGGLPGITAIYGESVRATAASFELVPPDTEEMTERWKTLVSNGYPYLAAVAGDTLLGFTYAGPYRSRPAYRFAVESSIYVAKSAHQSGIGSKLISKLIAICEEGPFRQMVAIIGDTSNPASEALHRKAGFQTVGRLRDIGHKQNQWLDTLIMQRPLGKGGATPPD